MTAVEDILEKIGVMAYITDPSTDDVIFVTRRARSLFSIDEGESGDGRLDLCRSSDVLRSDARSRDMLERDPASSVTLDEYSPSTGKFFKRTDSAITLPDGTVLHLHVLDDVTDRPSHGDSGGCEDVLESERRSREIFLVGMSHDFRNHINSILGMTYISEDESDSGKLHGAMETIARVSADMIMMLDDILDMSGIESLAGARRPSRAASPPQRVEMKQEMREAREKSMEMLRALDGCTILLVDDIELHRDIVRHFLDGTGLSICEANDGQEAVDIFARDPERYSLILMDIQMPHLSGHDAARAIRALPNDHAKTVPMIAMTANALLEDEDRSFASGMNGHLTKPLERTDLLTMLVYHLRESTM